jgi:GMP synthase (glutamine-hydrolysing)
MGPMHTSKSLAVIDLGGQYCHLISRRLRDLDVWSDIFAPEVSPKALAHYAGVILSGGPRSVNDPGAPTVDREILTMGKPLLGICYGHQLLAKMLHGDVRTGAMEFGPASLSVLDKKGLFEGSDSALNVWMSHSDSVAELPAGMHTLATTDRCKNAAYGDFDRNFFGVQFHPEVVHSQFGATLLDNFARRICKIRTREKIGNQVDHLVEKIRNRVGNDSVFFLVSGGVDSTVAFTLCARALPKDRLLGVYVDTGLMRKHETRDFHELLASLGLADRVHIRDERKRFLKALNRKVKPEQKRFIIGRLFVDIQREAMREYGIDEDHWLLGQGTIYPDTIESGGTSGQAALIKTHHNRCEEILHLIQKGRVIEPLAEFYKDEVRHLGEALGIDRRLTQRWPFPGPGLAVRCLCSRDSLSRSRPHQLPPGFKEFDAAAFPVRTVGVQGDSRTYRQALAVSGPLDYDALQKISIITCNNSDDFNRVIYLVASKFDNPLDVTSKRAFVGSKRVARLQNADYIVRQVMEEVGAMESVWQFPTVLLPLRIHDGDCVVLRPVNSQDGMTANFARLSEKVLRTIAGRILDQVPGIDAVFLDVTDKPPATIEWE